MKKRANGMTNVQNAESGATSKHRASVAFTVPGKLVSMKNSRRLLKNRRNGKMFSAKSEEAVNYTQEFRFRWFNVVRWMKGERFEPLGSLESPLRAHISVFYPSRRSDLDCALVYDCLQQFGVIANDRFIVEKHEFLHIDKENPRVEITVEEI